MNELAPLVCLDMPSVSMVEDVAMDDIMFVLQGCFTRANQGALLSSDMRRGWISKIWNAFFAADPQKLPGTLESCWGVWQGYGRSSFLASTESAWTSKPEASRNSRVSRSIRRMSFEQIVMCCFWCLLPTKLLKSTVPKRGASMSWLFSLRSLVKGTCFLSISIWDGSVDPMIPNECIQEDFKGSTAVACDLDLYVLLTCVILALLLRVKMQCRAKEVGTIGTTRT